MTDLASPWDALMRRSIARPRPVLAPGEKPPTKTAQLLEIIAQRGRVPTLALCVEMDMPSAAVWGLLKIPRQTGQVLFDGAHWVMGDDFVPPKIQKAAQLLRKAGWTVIEP